jgi:hypothetical protein
MREWWLMVLVGCGAGRVTVDVPVQFVPGSSLVTPAEGVELRLTEAEWTLSDLRLESPATTAWRRPWPSLIPTAYAHPGHDFTGGVSGELLGTWTLDLLGDAVDLGAARMLDGPYATARLHLDAAPVLRLSGEADVDGSPMPFTFELAHQQEITGIPFDADVDPDAPPSALVLGVDLAHALSFVDWRTEPGEDGVLTLADGAVENTLTFGVVSAPTWTLTTEE